ncbi:hypothetical protein, partial [Pandoraea sputorum]|uniref:hypothetical protein n=1 Tax=Pandoraea sputorum TaxID=93222 RepID=UPI003556E500
MSLSTRHNDGLAARLESFDYFIGCFSIRRGSDRHERMGATLCFPECPMKLDKSQAIERRNQQLSSTVLN